MYELFNLSPTFYCVDGSVPRQNDKKTMQEKKVSSIIM